MCFDAMIVMGWVWRSMGDWDMERIPGWGLLDGRLPLRGGVEWEDTGLGLDKGRGLKGWKSKAAAWRLRTLLGHDAISASRSQGLIFLGMGTNTVG